MVRLAMTPAIVAAIEYHEKALIGLHGVDNSTDPSLPPPAVGNPVSHGKVLEISKSVREFVESNAKDCSNEVPLYRLDDLLRGCRVYVEPAKPKAEPTSEYKALMARLRREEEAQAYDRMINPPLPVETFAQRFPGSQSAHLFPTSQEDIGESDEISYADVNRQMALIANVVISILACSVAIWIAAKYWSTPARLALSMGGSTLVGVAEVVVYAAYLGRLKDARARGNKEIEIKEIIKTWVIGNEEERPGLDKTTSVAPKPFGDNAVRRRKTTQR